MLYIPVIIMSLSMIPGCYPSAWVEKGMIADGQGYYQSENLNDKILLAVRQMVQTLKPRYRECDRLLKRYRKIRTGYHVTVEQNCKYTLGFVDITDLNRECSSRLHKYFTEKVLTYSFLQDVFSNQYVFVERISLPDTSLYYGWSGDYGAGYGGNDSQGDLVYDTGVAGVSNETGNTADKNKISTLRGGGRSKRTPSSYPASPPKNSEFARSKEYKKMAAEIRKMRKKLYSAEKKTVAGNSDQYDNEDPDDYMKINPTHYDSQIIAQFLGEKYDLDVVETGFLVDLGDVFELILRMIETRHGEVIAVGSVLIGKELISDELLYY